MRLRPSNRRDGQLLWRVHAVSVKAIFAQEINGGAEAKTTQGFNSRYIYCDKTNQKDTGAFPGELRDENCPL